MTIMTIRELIKQKKISIYQLAKLSEIPYATLNDICNGKAKLEKCSAETVYKLSQALEVSMEELLAPCFLKRSNFENYKSAICHRLKEMGDYDFIINTLQRDDIRILFERKWYPESLYLLAMLDYISRENNIPICNDYDDLRQYKLDKPIIPADILAISIVSKNDEIVEQAMKTAIPEFLRFNIIESEVRDVV